MIGMAIAVLATVFGSRCSTAARRRSSRRRLCAHRRRDGRRRRRRPVSPPAPCKMTQMPELVAIMHCLVGFAACAIGFASYIDTSTVFPTAAEHTHPPCSRSTSAC